MSRFNGLQHGCRGFRSIAKIGHLAVAAGLAFACVLPAVHAQDQTTQERTIRDIRSLNYTEKQALLKRIEKKLRYALDHNKPYPGQAAYTPLSVRFETEPHNEVLVIDLGAANGPFSQSADMSHFGSELTEPVTQMLDEAGISYPAFDFRFGGKDTDYYDPGNPHDPGKRLERRRLEGGEPQAAIPPEGARVVVSAMHGYYWRERDMEWALQRPELSNGIYEDFITPEFVAPLGNYLAARSGATVHLPRSRSLDAHPRAGYPWWQMAGRYYLKDLYPDNPEIWDSLDTPLPNRGWNLIQYDEDIRSRPYFANYINADAILNLHTNASSNPSASGARAYVALNRPYDLKLANNILCGMKELIHAQEGYENYNVPNQAQAQGNYGENNKANMPAVVLEIGFHTNANDAAALQDPVFRDAAMKGVEKGFRLHAKGKICEPFKVANIPDVTIPRPGSQEVPVNYNGFPRFPVTLTVENIACTPGNTCTGGTLTYSEWQPSPLRFEFSCSGSSETPTVSRWRSHLTDEDGVKTNAVEHKLTCTPTAGAAARAQPSESVRPTN